MNLKIYILLPIYAYNRKIYILPERMLYHIQAPDTQKAFHQYEDAHGCLNLLPTNIIKKKCLEHLTSICHFCFMTSFRVVLSL